MNQMLLSVVIPAYNEEGTLGDTIAQLRATLDEEKIPFEIVVADDASTDGTRLVLADLMLTDSRIRAVRRTPPRGFGRAVRSGLAAARGEVLVIYMADMSDHPHDVVNYYRKIEEGYDAVFGSRFVKGGKVEKYPWLKLIVNRIVNKVIQTIFWCKFNDLTNAFKAYRRHVLEDCGPFRASHFNITIEMSLAVIIRRYHIAQIPISWQGRTWGSSNLRLTEMGRRYLEVLLKCMAEKWLIADDLMAERLARNIAEQEQIVGQSRRLQALEERVAALENQQRPNPGPAAPAASSALPAPETTKVETSTATPTSEGP